MPRLVIDDLAAAARRIIDASIEADTIADAKPLFSFASHLASQKALVSEVGKRLSD